MNEQSDLGKRGRGVAPTLADVARTAGVSVSTAGRVLRDQGWPVEEGLKQRVLAAAAQLAYVPNVMARTLRGGAPAAVGLIVGNMLDPYYGEIAEIVTKHAEQMAGKMLVMVCNMQRDPALEIDYCRRLWEHRVAGLILAGGGFDQTTRHDELAELLARMERSGVTITTLNADLAAWTPPPATCAAVVLIYVHLPSGFRADAHRRLAGALAPGGWLVLESFHPRQLAYRSGGPRDVDMLSDLATIRADFAGLLEEVHGWEGEVELDEGDGHRGPAFVTRYVGRRAA